MWQFIKLYFSHQQRSQKTRFSRPGKYCLALVCKLFIFSGLALSACGGGNLEGEDETIAIESISLIIAGSSYTTNEPAILVRALAKTTDGSPAARVKIEFQTSLGTLSTLSVLTNDDGIADTYFSSVVSGSAQITAISRGILGQASIQVSPSPVASTNPAYLSIATSKPGITSNNKDVAVITATALDSNRGVIPGISVKFSANTGQLSRANVTTDSSGVASVDFSSGDLDPSNQIATITAQTAALTAQIPIKITGSSVSIVTSTSTLIVGGSPAEETITLTLRARDGGDRPVYNRNIDLTVTPVVANPGNATLSAAQATTDVNGDTSVTLTAVSAGEVTISATALGMSYSKNFKIQTLTSAFYISAPATENSSADIGANVTITASAPTQTQVTFVTTLGTVDDGGVPAAEVTTNVVAGSASVNLTSATGGVATIEAYDTSDNTVIDRVQVTFVAPAAQANKITLQTDRTVLPLSVGDFQYESTLTATVFNASGFPVQNAPVWFSISNSTGGGEHLVSTYGLSGIDGKVQTTFRSGNLSSAQNGVIITATISTGANSTVPIIIGGTAGSLAIGSSSTVGTVNSETGYQLPMSVLVADSNGNAVAGATVNLSAWPEAYHTGYWDKQTIGGQEQCVPIRTSSTHTVLGTETPSVPPYITNEDVNENLFLDAGEDVNSDGVLTPANSTAGALPQTVITDANGVASFNLTYLKQYGAWIVSRIRASTMVLGSEMTATLKFALPVLKGDAEECVLRNSPFGLDDTWRIPNT